MKSNVAFCMTYNIFSIYYVFQMPNAGVMMFNYTIVDIIMYIIFVLLKNRYKVGNISNTIFNFNKLIADLDIETNTKR